MSEGQEHLSRHMTLRRLLFAALVVATMALLVWLAAMALAPDGLDGIELVTLALFVIVMPWMVIGFWNALIGFVIMRFAGDPVAAVFPRIAEVGADDAIVSRTAVLICIRNESPQRAMRNLAPMVAGLAADKAAESFHLFILSDTDLPAVAAERGRRIVSPAEPAPPAPKHLKSRRERFTWESPEMYREE